MSCSSPGGTWGPIPVWSKKDDTNALFFPLSSAIPTAGLSGVRPSTEVGNSSGALKVQPAVRYSDDGVSWGTPAAIGTQSQTNDGISYGSSFTDVSSNAASNAFVQYGALVLNSSGTSLEMGIVTIKIDTE